MKNSNDNAVCHVVKSHFKVEKEGAKKDLFEAPERELEGDNFVKPRKKWKSSLAKQVLFNLLMEGKVPLEVDDTTMTLEEIYSLDDELMKYSFARFEERLTSLRTFIIELNKRADEDFEAFATYISNHDVSSQSHKGYAQWQGSTAQELLWDDLEAYMQSDKTPEALWKYYGRIAGRSRIRTRIY